jgi:hypothetical protein
MKYKVTALKDVRFLAYVGGAESEAIDGKILTRPTERLEWISLKAGQSRERLHMVVGVDPIFLPGEDSISLHGVRSVLLELPSSAEPRESFGLLRLEQQDD